MSEDWTVGAQVFFFVILPSLRKTGRPRGTCSREDARAQCPPVCLSCESSPVTPIWFCVVLAAVVKFSVNLPQCTNTPTHTSIRTQIQSTKFLLLSPQCVFVYSSCRSLWVAVASWRRLLKALIFLSLCNIAEPNQEQSPEGNFLIYPEHLKY